MAVNDQVGIIERTTNNEIKSANKVENDRQIMAMHDSTDIKIKANKEENDKQISVMKELVNIQINAMNKISDQTTKASESKIESILMSFTAQNYNQNYNRSGDEN